MGRRINAIFIVPFVDVLCPFCNIRKLFSCGFFFLLGKFRDNQFITAACHELFTEQPSSGNPLMYLKCI